MDDKAKFDLVGESEIGNILFRAKVVDMFINFEKTKSLSELAKDVNLTYSHVFKLVRKFEEAGLIVQMKLGRIKQVMYTEKGAMLRDNLKKCVENLKKE